MALNRTEESGERVSEAVFAFRPWVRKAGWSIVLVAGGVSAILISLVLILPIEQRGWLAEPFGWLYVAVLWLGGLRILLGTSLPVVEMEAAEVLLRPLHLLRSKRIRWCDVRGIEQTIPGNRLILYYDGTRGTRYVALNLNLVRGRRQFMEELERRLKRAGFLERTVERSRVLSRPESLTPVEESNRS